MSEAAQEGSRGTPASMFHGGNSGWRTARQGSEAANGEKTAREAPRRRSLPRPHARSEGDRARFSHDSLRSGSATASPNPARSPSGRLRTAPTATLPTATGNGPTAPTARKENRARTAWELRELIRPLPTRRAPRRTKTEQRHFDPALVEYVYDSRFVIVSQLQRHFPDRLPSLRTAQRHAARLVDAGLLATAPVRSTSPNFPAVYYATGRGRRLIRDTYAAYGHDWDGPATEERKARGLALDSILHEVLVSELDLAVHRTVDARDDLTLLNRERRYFRRDRQLTYWKQGKRRQVVPDAGYLVAMQQPEGRQLLSPMFVELENGTHSVARIQRKLGRYQEWWEQKGSEYLRPIYDRYAERQNRPSFRLLIVAHDKHGTVSDRRRLLDLFAQTLELPRSMRDKVWLACASDLQRQQTASAPLDAPIWYRVRDARHWLPEYRRLCENLPNQAGRKRHAEQRQFIAERLKKLPRHPLFPRLR